MRKALIKLFTFLGGIYFFLEFVLPDPFLGIKFNAYHDQISQGFVAVGVMAIGLGLINLFMVHGSKIVFRRSGWGNSMALLFGLLFMFIVTGMEWMRSEAISSDAERFYVLRDFSTVIVTDDAEQKENVPELAVRITSLVTAADKLLTEQQNAMPSITVKTQMLEGRDAEILKNSLGDLQAAHLDAQKSLTELTACKTLTENCKTLLAALGASLGQTGSVWREIRLKVYEQQTLKKLYEFLFKGLFESLGAAMFSLLGFYIAAAAYRAFRVRSLEAGLMMTAAIVVMLGQIPFGIWIYDGLPAIRLWIMEYPNAAAFRAITLGALVAALIMAFRMWFSIESESFESDRMHD